MRQADLDQLIAMAQKTWTEIAISLGLSDEVAGQLVKRELNGVLEDAAGDRGGVLFDEPLGTKWVKGKEPSNSDEKAIMATIQACSVNFEREKVGLEDVMWLWDLSHVERFVEIRTVNIIRYAIFVYLLENGGSFDSFEQGAEKVGVLVHKYTPSFDMCHPSYYKQDPCHPLPYELSYVVNNWYLQTLAAKGLDGLSEMAGASDCVNAEARRLRKAGKI
jgi:hypothetical protein